MLFAVCMGQFDALEPVYAEFPQIFWRLEIEMKLSLRKCSCLERLLLGYLVLPTLST